MRRVLCTLALVVLAFGLATPPAPAKGPTHLLLVAPTAGADVVLEMSDPRAAEVEALLGRTGEVVRGRAWERWHEVDVAWMMQAIDVFRSDIVFLDGKGAVVVMSEVVSAFGEPGHSTEWRYVRNGEVLTALFDDLGLLGGEAPAKGSADKDTSATAAATAPGSSSSPPAEASGSSDGAAGWRWALPGLLAGLVLGAVGSGLLRRRPGQVVAQRLASS